ncbi:MAG: hypothetical protein PHE59_00015 [Patescibacteria group bacterium]|nr:hypothetical protein [Patescibacteria group bacterium]MDD5164562.1 hypothetical protein [Patescibacteria group bacterium]MDD5534313.1 hypothetical protein [Patescibacteria group bacterium]
MAETQTNVQTFTETIAQKRKLEKIIISSLLDEEDKKLWFQLIHQLNLEQVDIFIDLIQNSPDNLNKLTANLKEKIKIIASGNQESIQSLLNEEEKMIESLGG